MGTEKKCLNEYNLTLTYEATMGRLGLTIGQSLSDKTVKLVKLCTDQTKMII